MDGGGAGCVCVCVCVMFVHALVEGGEGEVSMFVEGVEVGTGLGKEMPSWSV